MKNRVFGAVVMVMSIVSGMLFMTSGASAADLLPEPIQNLFDLMGEDGSGTSEFATSRIRMFLLLGLGALILMAVVYAAFAALKYIRSQGDPGQIEEAGKAVRAIFMGLAMMLIAVVGIVLIFVFFGTGLFDTSSYQVCLSAANSQGCIACQAEGGGLPEDWDTIKFNTANPGAINPADNQQSCLFCEWEYFQKSTGTGGITINSFCREN